MGRFDALTQLEEPKIVPAHKSTSGQVVLSTAPLRTEAPKPQKEKPVSKERPKLATKKPEKYTTHLDPSMVKKIKVYAAQHDCNDYDVVAKAMQEFFEK